MIDRNDASAADAVAVGRDDGIAAAAPALRARHRLLAPLAAAALGIVLLTGAGLAQTGSIHDAAHDARHAAGFPCH